LAQDDARVLPDVRRHQYDRRGPEEEGRRARAAGRRSGLRPDDRDQDARRRRARGIPTKASHSAARVDPMRQFFLVLFALAVLFTAMPKATQPNAETRR